MKKVEYSVPATRDQGPCKIIGTSSASETCYENALWEYNSMRAHDGQHACVAFPRGTTWKEIMRGGDDQ